MGSSPEEGKVRTLYKTPYPEPSVQHYKVCICKLLVICHLFCNLMLVDIIILFNEL